MRAAGLEAAERDPAVAIEDPWHNTILLTVGEASVQAAGALRAAASRTA